MPKILIIGAGEMQLPSIVKAKEMGLYVIAVDINPQAPGLKFADVVEIVSTDDLDGVIKVAEQYNIDAVLTCSDFPVRTLAAVGERMGIPAISVDNSYKATNKWLMRRALRNYGVPIPFFTKATNFDEFLQAVKEVTKLGSKVIVKPADSSGSRGVHLLERMDQEYLKSVYEYSKENSHFGEVVVEEFMEGPEVCVETLSYNGECKPIQITDKLTTGSPYFVEMGHSQPSQHSKEIQEEIYRTAIAANMAIGNYNGSSCTEIKITKDGVKVVELGARLAGDYMTSDLVPLSTGVDMMESVIKISLGDKPNWDHKYEKASAIRFFCAKLGTIKNFIGVKEAEAIDGVVRVAFLKNIGDESVIIKSSLDRVGYVIAQADTPAKAVEIAEKSS